MKDLTQEQIQFFNVNGYLVIKDVLTPDEVVTYRQLYDDFLSNKIDANRFRSDLGGHVELGDKPAKERITQIMVPSRILPSLINGPLHQRTLLIAKELCGQDMELDFDMLINKAPFTDTATPWHQDAAYWLKLPDVRAVSCWTALDETFKENGCMWYGRGSHLLPIRKHRLAGKGGGALECDATEDEGIAIEILPGTTILHHGGTLHYSRGNSTDKLRRAFITNYRPEAMIKYEREQGYDHTGEREIRNKT